MTADTYSIFCLAGVYEECQHTARANLTYRTYAHHFYNRLLVTEIHVARDPDDTGEITLTREDLSGPNTTDIIFQPTEDYNVSVCDDLGWTCK